MSDDARDLSHQPELPPLRLSVARTIARVVAVAIAALAISWLTGWAMEYEAQLPAEGPVTLGILAGLLAAYAILLAIPFVPGVEIGLMILMVRGSELAGFVYLATLLGLFAAYVAGRHLPYAWLERIFLDLRMRQASALLHKAGALSPPERLALLKDRLRGRFAARLIAGRYLLLAVLVNLPGNAIIGGGGGLLLLAGLTRLFSTSAVLATLALAVAPVPLLVWLFEYSGALH